MLLCVCLFNHKPFCIVVWLGVRSVVFCLLICLLDCVFFGLFFCQLCVCLLFLYVFLCFVCLFVFPFVLFCFLFDCLFICLFICLFACPFVCLLVCLSVCLFVYLSTVCLCVSSPIVVLCGRLPQSFPGIVSRPLDTVGHSELLGSKFPSKMVPSPPGNLIVFWLSTRFVPESKLKSAHSPITTINIETQFKRNIPTILISKVCLKLYT